MTDEINFDEVEGSLQEVEMGVEDFSGGNYLKCPKVGEVIEFTVDKVINNKNTKMVNKTTNKEFQLGIKEKSGAVRRYDIHTTDGAIFTIPNWELFFKLFKSGEGLLIKHALANKNSFKGAKIRIKRLLDYGHVNTKVEDLMKILDKTEEETKAYQENIRQAMKEGKLYEVTTW